MRPPYALFSAAPARVEAYRRMVEQAVADATSRTAQVIFTYDRVDGTEGPGPVVPTVAVVTPAYRLRVQAPTVRQLLVRLVGQLQEQEALHR